MKEFWDSLTKEQQSTLAASVGSTPGYLRLVFNGYKKALIWPKSWKTTHQARSRSMTFGQISIPNNNMWFHLK